MRDVSISCGVVNGVTGSAYIEMGTTKVVCAVRGPRELNHGEEFKMEVGVADCCYSGSDIIYNQLGYCEL